MTSRPATVTTFLWLVLCLTAWNAVRLIAALSNWNLLREFASRPGPVYILVTASFWALSGFALWQALRRRVSGPRGPFLFVLAYAAWWWADRLLFQSADANWPSALTLTLLVCAWAGILLFHPRTRAYLERNEAHDPEPSNSESA